MNKLIVVIFVVAGLGLIWSISGFFSLTRQNQIANSAASQTTAPNLGSDPYAAKAFNAELQDKCQTPAGYTDEEWLEHMGHHPDRYVECLNQ